MKTLNILLAVLLLATSAAGATDLAELQQTALENRKVINRYQVNLEKAAQGETIAKSGYYPSVDLSYTATSMNGSSAVNPFVPTEYSVAVGSVSMNLFAGFRDKYNIRSSELQKQAETYRLDGLLQDIQLNVALLYLNIYDSRSRLKVAEDQLATLEKIYRDETNRFDVGLIDKNELLKFKVDLDNAAITFKQAQAEVDKNVQLLNRAIDAEVKQANLSFNEFDELPTLADEEQYQADMLQNRSEIKTLEEVGRAADMQIKIEHADYYPRVDLVGTYNHYEDALVVGSGSYRNDELSGQLVLTMNLFDGQAKRSRQAQAELEAQGVRYDLAELQKDLASQLTNLFIDYRVSVDNAGAALTSITQAEENLRITRLKYEQGLQRESDLLDAIANLSRARSNYVVAKTRVFANYFQIQRMAEKF